MPTMEAPTTPRRSQSRVMRSQRKKLDHQFVLRCIAFPQGGSYIAECIDLDITVRGKTADQAMRSLMQAVVGHLKVALDGDGFKELADTGRVQGLIPRRAPLSHRLRYHMYCLRAATSGPGRNFRLFDCPPDTECPSFT